MSQAYVIEITQFKDALSRRYLVKMQKFCLVLVLIFAFASQSAYALDQGTDITLAGRHVVYWAPPTQPAAPPATVMSVPDVSDASRAPSAAKAPAPSMQSDKKPILLFSHAYGGCATQSIALMAALAANGYWVFAPDHHDASCSRTTPIRAPTAAALEDFKSAESWNDGRYVDRREDLIVVLNALKSNPDFSERIDFTQLGLLGHSLGGYDVLAMAGAWPTWRLNGVKAVIAFAPYAEPFNLKHTVKNIGSPLMLQGATKDLPLNTPNLIRHDGTYEQAMTPKYLVEFKDATHLSWTDADPTFNDDIILYSIAFLNHYIKGEPASSVLTTLNEHLALFEYNSDLGNHSENAAFATPSNVIAPSRMSMLKQSVQNYASGLTSIASKITSH